MSLNDIVCSIRIFSLSTNEDHYSTIIPGLERLLNCSEFVIDLC